jgi:hypothetical protein
MSIEDLESMTYEESRRTYGHTFTQEELTQVIANAKQNDCKAITLKGTPSPQRWKYLVSDTYSYIQEDGEWKDVKGWGNEARIVKHFMRSTITLQCIVDTNMANEELLMKNLNEQEYMSTMDGMMCVQNILIPYLKCQMKMFKTIKTPKNVDFLEKMDQLTEAMMSRNAQCLCLPALMAAWQNTKGRTPQGKAMLYAMTDTPMDEEGKKYMDDLKWMVDHYTGLLDKY